MKRQVVFIAFYSILADPDAVINDAFVDTGFDLQTGHELHLSTTNLEWSVSIGLDYK